MAIHISGNDTTRKLIQNIVQDLPKNRPETKFVDYSLTLKQKYSRSTLITDEQIGADGKHILRNVSLIKVGYSNFKNGIKAAIGNNTGAILIQEKPFFISTKTAIKRIQKFLSQLQPENQKPPKEYDRKMGNHQFKGNSHFYNSYKTKNLTQDNLTLRKVAQGSDNAESIEVFEPYKNL